MAREIVDDDGDRPDEFVAFLQMHRKLVFKAGQAFVDDDTYAALPADPVIVLYDPVSPWGMRLMDLAGGVPPSKEDAETAQLTQNACTVAPEAAGKAIHWVTAEDPSAGAVIVSASAVFDQQVVETIRKAIEGDYLPVCVAIAAGVQVVGSRYAAKKRSTRSLPA